VVHATANDPNAVWPKEISGVTVWNGKELEAHPEQWVYPLSADEIADIDSALKHFKSLNKPLIEIEKSNFPFRLFSKVLEDHRKILLEGRGFTLVRGFPI